MSRYCIVDEKGLFITDGLFKTKKDFELFISKQIVDRGFDWRVGNRVQFKDGTGVDLIWSKTGESVRYTYRQH